MSSRTARVVSFSYSSKTFYAEFHPNFPLSRQASRIKKSFAESDGASVEIYSDPLHDVKIDYDGALTIFSDLPTGNFLPEYCYGVDANIINYPGGVKDFLAGMSYFGEIENAVVCLPGGGYNLHHFVLEILPAILLFRDEVKAAGSLVLGATPGASFLQEFNEIFHLNQNLKLVPLNASLKLRRSTNISAFPFRIYPIDLINEIRVEVTRHFPALTSIGSDILFIGRRDFDRNRRALTNEEQVIDLLRQSFGKVALIRPGVSELSQTVGAVQRARVLVGPTGGNLAHLIWAKNLEVFIEIVPDGYFGDTETEELSKIFGFKYLRVSSKSLPNQEWNYSDQACNLAEFQAMLNQNFS